MRAISALCSRPNCLTFRAISAPVFKTQLSNLFRAISAQTQLSNFYRDNDPYACNVPHFCAGEAPCWIASLCFSEFTGSKIPRVLLIVLEELVIVELVVVLLVVVVVVVVLVIIIVVLELVVVVIVLALVILVVEDRISSRRPWRQTMFVSAIVCQLL